MIAALLGLIVATIAVALTEDASPRREILRAAITFFIYAIPVCLLGWIVSLTTVVPFPNTSGRRLWAILLIGSSIGPAATYLIAAVLAFAFGGPTLVDRLSNALTFIREFPHQGRADLHFLELASLISVTSAATYLLLLRRAERTLPTS